MTVLITGASSGLGKCCAERLTAEGNTLVLIGRNEATLRESFPAAKVYACDLTDEVALKATLTLAKTDSGPIGGWVLAAGVQAIRPLMMESAASLHASFAANVQSSLGLLALALKMRMVTAGGSIVLFSSAATHSGGAGLVGYAAAKGALEAATRSLAVELASQKVRVNAVAPGVIRTPMSEKYLGKLSPEQIAKIEEMHPLGFGQPEDVAGPVQFLLSEDARWITGSVMSIDGGLSIR
jgi:NAD(P)-dependent dehydrogenase (short-subunit alcohol dehydrogenase family)